MKLYPRGALVPYTIGQRLVERAGLIRMNPQHILDLSTSFSSAALLLQSQYPNATIHTSNITEKTLILEDFPDRTFDCIIANCSLHGLDLPIIFAACQRILRPGGCFLWSTFGPDTLKELAFIGCDTSACVDMHDIGDIALHAKFKDPVLDRQDLTIRYPKLITLLRDLHAMDEIRGMGGFFSVRTHLRVRQPFTASYEILYGLAFTHQAPHTYPIAPIDYA